MKEIEIYDGPGYTVVYNQLIQDGRMRLQTRAVLILMLSKPPEWDYSVRGMAAIAGVSKDTMTKMFREIMDAGYMRRMDQGHDAGGKFAKAGYVVAGRPVFRETDDGEPCPNSPDTVNSPQENKVGSNIYTPPYNPPRGDGAPEKKRRKREPKEAPDWKPERFAGFWAFYPRGEAKQAAIRAWDKLQPSDELIDTMAQALKRQAASEAWQRGIGIPYASTWLNQRRWTDQSRRGDPERDEPVQRRVVETEGLPVWQNLTP